MNNIITILRKQTKDTLKNRIVFLQFFMCPALALVMEKFMQAEGTPPLFYLRMMSGMYITFAPITAMASIMSEEKEKNTLRVLIMSNVKAWQYILGTGIYVISLEVFLGSMASEDLDCRSNRRHRASVLTLSLICMRNNLNA